MGVGWLLSLADSGGAKLDVGGVAACEGVVCAEEGGGDSCYSRREREHHCQLSVYTPYPSPEKANPHSQQHCARQLLQRIASPTVHMRVYLDVGVNDLPA